MVADASLASSLFCANAKNYKPVWRDRQSGKSIEPVARPWGGGPASEELARPQMSESEITSRSTQSRQQDQNGGFGLRRRKNADGKTRRSKRRSKELAFRLS